MGGSTLRSIIVSMQSLRFTCRSVVLALCSALFLLVLLGAKSFVKPVARAAINYPAHDFHRDSKVAIAADTYNNAIEELPHAFVDPTARLETADAGTGTLPVVLPATESLFAPFTPTSDQSWLTISDITNGVVTFSFTANFGSSRTAHL